MLITDLNSMFYFFSFFIVHAQGSFLLWVWILEKSPATCNLPFFLKGCLRRNPLFEMRLGHSADISVLKRRVESVYACEVAFGAVIDVG